jgi:3-oxoacyl-[acyl-carrier protein] reductase
MVDTGLKNKVVLVTGANNPVGIGAAIASAFAREGARVGITYLRLLPDRHGYSLDEVKQARQNGMAYYHAMRTLNASSVIEKIHINGGAAAELELDLTIPGSEQVLFDWAEQVFGPVDVLVNNAAHYEEEDTTFTATQDGFERTFQVNTFAGARLAREYVRRYQERDGKFGRIISLSTDAAQTFASQIAYGASKAAVEALTRSMAIEVGPLGITVNAVAPGPVQTGYISAETEARLIADIPLRRIGRPEDIAEMILFLASEQTSWVTGQVIKVSGGHCL